MACRQACNLGYLPPVDDYLSRYVANDNRPLWTTPDWLANMLSITCCAAQLAWSAFLIAQFS